MKPKKDRWFGVSPYPNSHGFGKYPRAWKEIYCQVCNKAKMVWFTAPGKYCSERCSAMGRRRKPVGKPEQEGIKDGR
jgi:hypothetical protein